MNFNFNQLMNAEEVYKNLANYKARALVYQAVLLTDNIEKKIRLSFLLKELFKKDKIFYVYADEMANILESMRCCTRRRGAAMWRTGDHGVFFAAAQLGTTPRASVGHCRGDAIKVRSNFVACFGEQLCSG